MLITVFEGCLHLVVVGFNSHSNCIAIRVNPMIFMNLSFQKISMLAVTSTIYSIKTESNTHSA